jgi:hypothetical protein
VNPTPKAVEAVGITIAIVTTAAAEEKDGDPADESAEPQNSMHTKQTAARPKQTVNEPTARSVGSPHPVTAVMSAVTVTVTVLGTATSIVVLVLPGMPTHAKTSANVFTVPVVTPVAAVMSLTTVAAVILAVWPVETVGAGATVILKALPAGLRSVIVVIAVSGIAAGARGLLVESSLPFPKREKIQNKIPSRMRRLFTLAAKKAKLRRRNRVLGSFLSLV